MAIWEWVLEAYAQPGVPEACLKLQDDYCQNTNLLLWAVWAEAKDPALIARAAEVTRAWEAVAVRPLREVRRALKAPVPPVDDRVREALREDVKEAELRAERILLETLESLSGDTQGGAHALEALRAASAAWQTAAPDSQLAALAGALG